MQIKKTEIEEEMINEVDQERFYKYLNSFDFDVNLIFFNERKTNKEIKQEFNYILRKIKSVYGLNIMDSVLHLERDYANINSIVQLLDEDNIYQLKTELNVEFHLRKKFYKNRLKDFLRE